MRAKPRQFRLWRLMMLLIMASVVLPAAAQQGAPDYAIRSIRSEITQGGSLIAVVFDVVNNGGDATAAATAQVLDNTGTQIGSTVTVEPLAEFESVPVRIEFPTYLFANRAGQIVSLTATVGLNEIEPEGLDSARDNIARISLPVPNLDAVVEPGEDTAPALDAPPEGIPGAFSLEGALRGDPVSIFGTTIDGRVVIILAVVLFFLLLLLIWIATLFLRVIFSTPPTFPNWQPPYAAAAYLDPNSLPGRRALWQPHAQNDALPMPCQPGSFVARKLMLGVNGQKLAGWRVIGIRLNQYDMYGRVARSQVIATTGLAKRLDRLVQRSASLDYAHAEKAVRPIARRLAREFGGKLNKRSAMLPLAMDVRLDGRHGEVRIAFELLQCTGEGYQPVDTWEPEMVVTTNGGIIHENLTYTLFGQRQGEKVGAFTARLTNDIARTLAALVAGMNPPPPKTPPARRGETPPAPPTPPSTPPVPVNPPEVTGDTSPINASTDQTAAQGGTRRQEPPL